MAEEGEELELDRFDDDDDDDNDDGDDDDEKSPLFKPPTSTSTNYRSRDHETYFQNQSYVDDEFEPTGVFKIVADDRVGIGGV